MAAPNIVTVTQYFRLVGSPAVPRALGMQFAEGVAADLLTPPIVDYRNISTAAAWATGYDLQSVAVARHRDPRFSQDAATWLRHTVAQAESLEGGLIVAPILRRYRSTAAASVRLHSMNRPERKMR